MLILASVIIGQLFFAAHAIEHGTEPHEHNGVACLTVLNDELEDVLPTARVDALSFESTKSAPLPLANQFFSPKNMAVRPPSTGPPSD